jgi:hypothetical protein
VSAAKVVDLFDALKAALAKPPVTPPFDMTLGRHVRPELPKCSACDGPATTDVDGDPRCEDCLPVTVKCRDCGKPARWSEEHGSTCYRCVRAGTE